jgi:hypothetical protein
VWHWGVLQKLRQSGLFVEVILIGGKVRARINDSLFLDIHHDPTSGSYSYALIDLTLCVTGDKRICGWDDYPHEGFGRIRELSSYPHHFQRRTESGEWIFEVSSTRGNVEQDMDVVLDELRRHLGG